MIFKNIIKDKYLLFLIFLFIIFSIFFSISAIGEHNHFGSWAWDLGIYDQDIWLMKNNLELFNTVRGMHTFGNHVTPINYFISFVFFIKEDVRLLLILQSLLIVSTIFPIYLLSIKLFNKKSIGILLSLSFLLYPAVQYAIIEDFHPETLAFPIIFWIFYFAESKKWALTIIFSILLLLIKEDFAVVAILIGLFILFRYNKRTGIIISSISLAWFVFVMTFLLKYFNGVGYWRNLYGWNIFGGFGSNLSDFIKNIIAKPIGIIKLIFTYEDLKYMLSILLPVSFIPLLSGTFILIWLPFLILNLTMGGYLSSIIYHYTIPLVPLLFIAIVLAVKRYKKYALWLALLILLFAFVGNLLYSPPYSSIKNFPKNLAIFEAFNDLSDKEKAINNFISQIPKDAKVSATYLYVPHLTHRQYIYMFPNPFRLAYWGINGENPPIKDVDYIFVDRNLISTEDNLLLDNLINNKEFEVIDSIDKTVLLKRYNITHII